MLVLVVDFLRLMLMRLMPGSLYYSAHQEDYYLLHSCHSYFDLEVGKGVDLVVDLVDDLGDYFLNHYCYRHRHRRRRLVTSLVNYYSLSDI